jgi:hypothetical protein
MKLVAFIPPHCALLISLACLRLHAQQQPNDAASDSENRRTHSREYAALNRQVKHIRGDATSGLLYHSESEEDITAKLKGIVQSEVISHLDAPNAEKVVRIDINEVQTFRPGTDPSAITNTPFIRAFELLATRQAAVAYTLDEGYEFLPDIQPYLEFYDKVSGDWQLRATAPTMDDFRASTFFVQQMNSGIKTESWWLAWGSKLGNTGGVKRVVLYAYDGMAVKIIWRRDELIGAEISATADTVTLEYDPEYKPHHPMTRIHEIYSVTPNGLLQFQ